MNEQDRAMAEYLKKLAAEETNLQTATPTTTVTPVSPTPRESFIPKQPGDDLSFISGLILVTTIIIILIFVRKPLIRLVRSLLTVFKKFISGVNPLYVILLLIALVLFFGLFKTEIKVWRIRNHSKFFEVVNVKGNYSCSKYVNADNPNYEQELIEASKNGPESSPKFLECMGTRTDEVRKSICRLLSKPQRTKRVLTESVCEGVRAKETWLKIFGVKIWKVSQQEIDPITGAQYK